MRSARIVSSVIRMTLGSRGAGGRGAAAPAIALAARQRTHSNPRGGNIGYKKSIIGGFVANTDRVMSHLVEGRASRPSSRAGTPGSPPQAWIDSRVTADLWTRPRPLGAVSATPAP